MVDMHAVANAGNRWVALLLQLDAGLADPGAVWAAVFATPELLAAVAPLDCIVLLATPALLTPALLEAMPANRVLFAIAATALAEGANRGVIAALQQQGYRVLIDCAASAGLVLAPTLCAVSRDWAGWDGNADGASGAISNPVAKPAALLALFGPHLARGVASAERRAQCADAGFAWFSGAYPLHPAPLAEANDAGLHQRLLSLLALIAADADARQIETLLKQDAVLAYQLLKLVNSAAFAPASPVTSCAQAIALLGRRQLQRWLQLLLFARPRCDGLGNALLPIAALRAAQMASLCALGGGTLEAQDAAFMVGAFSLLDVLLQRPMADIVASLNLPVGLGAALSARQGRLGQWLTLVAAPTPLACALRAADITPGHWWHSQLHAYHWAIQVSRSV
ncbi:MAG: HDOD domain-containing protein [Massilia sp.]|nr:HDOD domain-containing protein [Massilia sp.]